MPALPVLSAETVSTRDGEGRLYTHSLEAELLGPLPRPARRTPLAIAVRWMLCILMAGCLCLLAYFGQRDADTWDALLRHGKTARATVSGKYATRNDQGTHYILTYTFRTADGFERSGSMSVDQGAYDRAKDGDSATRVTYLPSSHGQIWEPGVVTARGRASRKRAWILVAANIAFTWCLLIGFCEWTWKRQMRMLQNGAAVMGQVTQGKVTQGHKGQTYYDLYYQFPVGGETISRTARVGKSFYQAHTQGNPFLTVLYNPANPRMSRPYFPLKWAQIDPL